MSQAKVDKYKEEKKNRAKTMKRQKVKKAIAIIVVALGIGALIGIPLGKYIYKFKKEQEAKKATIVSDKYATWFEEYWGKNYSDVFGGGIDADDLNELIDDYNASASDADQLESVEDGETVQEIELDGDDVE
ncbi:MAG: hypothetical protein K6B68_12510 [Eubacterium sp.]|nr:hypothetical protein [Eubacterium sp.]